MLFHAGYQKDNLLYFTLPCIRRILWHVRGISRSSSVSGFQKDTLCVRVSERSFFMSEHHKYFLPFQKCSEDDLSYQGMLFHVGYEKDNFHVLVAGGNALKGLSHEIFGHVCWPVWMHLDLNKNRFWF